MWGGTRSEIAVLTISDRVHIPVRTGLWRITYGRAGSRARRGVLRHAGGSSLAARGLGQGRRRRLLRPLDAGPHGRLVLEADRGDLGRRGGPVAQISSQSMWYIFSSIFPYDISYFLKAFLHFVF